MDITKYNFIVGSIGYKQKLIKILPKEVNVVCLPYIVEDPTTIYIIKKFDIKDYLFIEPNMIKREE